MSEDKKEVPSESEIEKIEKYKAHKRSETSKNIIHWTFIVILLFILLTFVINFLMLWLAPNKFWENRNKDMSLSIFHHGIDYIIGWIIGSVANKLLDKS